MAVSGRLQEMRDSSAPVHRGPRPSLLVDAIGQGRGCVGDGSGRDEVGGGSGVG